MTRQWETIKEYKEIKYEFYNGIAKVTINRPEVRNAFTPNTVQEMIDAFTRARDDQRISVIVLTGEGDKAFCSGGDQKVRGHGGYVGEDQIPRLNVLDLQRLIRIIPKPVISMVRGYAIGGGNVLNVVCYLTIAADNAIFGQTGPNIALSAAIVKSQTTFNTFPPPIAYPLTIAMTGFGIIRINLCKSNTLRRGI